MAQVFFVSNSVLHFLDYSPNQSTSNSSESNESLVDEFINFSIESKTKTNDRSIDCSNAKTNSSVVKRDTSVELYPTGYDQTQF